MDPHCALGRGPWRVGPGTMVPMWVPTGPECPCRSPPRRIPYSPTPSPASGLVLVQHPYQSWPSSASPPASEPPPPNLLPAPGRATAHPTIEALHPMGVLENLNQSRRSILRSASHIASVAVAVTAPAGRAGAVERARPTWTCAAGRAPLLPNEAGAEEGVEGRRREARRRPKKLRFIGHVNRHLKKRHAPTPLSTYFYCWSTYFYTIVTTPL
jgi:hypothetical protein